MSNYVDGPWKWRIDTLQLKDITNDGIAACDMDPFVDGSCNAVPQAITGDVSFAVGRLGNKYMIYEWAVQGYVLVPVPVSATSDQLIKLWFVVDHQTKGAQMKSDQFLSDNAFQAVAPLYFTQLRRENRFTVLHTEVINIKSRGFTRFRLQPFEFEHKWPEGLEVQCSGAGGTVADVVTNSLHVVASSRGTEEDNQMAYNTRIRFKG